MTRDEHNAAIQNIMRMIAPEHQAAASEALSALTSDYNDTLTARETAENNARNLTTDNEALRKANMQLFLKVGNTPSPGDTHTNPVPKEEPIPSFDELFDTNGGLK